jgi:hypothetical protein
MQALDTLVKARVAAGAAPADDAVAVEFFKAEASVWASKS